MKLTQAQKSFLTDIAYPKCHELFTAQTGISSSQSSKASATLFESCLENFDITLIPACSSLIPAFINYYQSRITKSTNTV